MERQVRDADFVLMICTPTYLRRVMGEEEPGVGHGVNWEGNLIYQHFYKDGTINTRFLPILLEGRNTSDIPVPFRGVAKYRPMTEEGYEALYRRLTNQPLTPPPDIGTPKKLPPRERPQQVFENSHPDDSQKFIENVPYERNAFFTGREPLLRQLHEMLHQKGSSALSQPQALSGLGGIGKTQTALEYSYRYRHEYHAIFWIRAESEAALNTSYTEIAKRLALAEQEAPDPDKIVQAVKHWVEQHEQWLLIFDNADTPASLKRYVPRHATGKGHLLLTSRAQVFDMLGIARPMEVQEMQPEEAVAFLLKRTGRDEPDLHERTAGEQLAKELGYLPLALEQSSAYILEEHARFQDYLASYRKQRLALLNKAQPKATDYPKSVETTWAINFREVEKEPAAADILRLSAFLGPDHIPLELLTNGAGHLGPILAEVLARTTNDPLVLDETLEPLTRYSLIHRDVDAQTYSLHRLVQEAVKDKMDAATRQLWTERAVRMVDESFPFNEDAPWPLSQRYLLHALECATHIKQHHMAFDEAAHLLNSVGVYFWRRGQYEDVEPLYQQAQTIMEQVEGPNALNTLYILNNLASRSQRALPSRTRAGGTPHESHNASSTPNSGSTSKPSRSTSAPWPSANACWEPSTPTPRTVSITCRETRKPTALQRALAIENACWREHPIAAVFTAIRGRTSKPSRSTSAPWPSANACWEPSTPTPPRVSITWENSTPSRGSMSKPSRSTSAPWPSANACWEPSTPTRNEFVRATLNC